MKINKMTASFGKLENESIAFHDGLNVVCAPNESGKSTWCAFIKSMLYGVDSSERAKIGYLPDKMRYAPWSGAPMEGSMELTADNCDITMRQPDSMAKHDMKKGANPMLARGNDRADGSTVIQNSRITLSGDNGRRICYQLSALKGNTLDVSLGYGIASTKEVSGNTIRGRIRHKVFQDCSGVENNNVEVRRFSILG